MYIASIIICCPKGSSKIASIKVIRSIRLVDLSTFSAKGEFPRFPEDAVSLNDIDPNYSLIGWCRVEMFYAANVPLSVYSTEKRKHFMHGLKSCHEIGLRPHL